MAGVARVVVEMGGGNKGEQPSHFEETRSAPDWVKLALMDSLSPGSSVRWTYDDGSFTEWRLTIRRS